ncbi:Calx-beta domain-containing protein [Marivirga sp.]|uniref:Calx-beta domain-containing protein n=1 Tax=Marivirga sp. TaxID=2018662 RepID=UPI002D7EA616|nr:Calx-beta domain-containing protein [Marivirga sp.]HET8861296.1 Calx-beta domain-containing protein [Marivirga sp.]
MKNINFYIKSILFAFVAVFFMACEGEEESISLNPGSNLLISGSGEILTYQDTEYFVRGHDMDETYTWSIEPAGTATVTQVEGRNGEFVTVVAQEVGTYTLTVENNQGLSGDFTIVVEDIDEFAGITDTLNIFEEQYNAGGDTLFFPVRIQRTVEGSVLAGRNVEETRISFDVTDGSAIEGTDYEILNDEVIIEKGELEGYISILTIDNDTDDGPKDFFIELTGVTQTGPGNTAVTLNPDEFPTSSVVYINDDIKTVDLDIEFDEVEVSEAGNYFVDVVLNRAIDEDVTIQYSVTNAAGTPFILNNPDKTGGSLEVFAGETETRIVLDIDESWVQAGAEPTEINIELTGVTSQDGEIGLGETTTYVVNAVAPEQ